MTYDTHADWCQHLAELGILKSDPDEDHNACLLSDRCVATPRKEKSK